MTPFAINVFIEHIPVFSTNSLKQWEAFPLIQPFPTSNKDLFAFRYLNLQIVDQKKYDIEEYKGWISSFFSLDISDLFDHDLHMLSNNIWGFSGLASNK
jgi:hypothetical protein